MATEGKRKKPTLKMENALMDYILHPNEPLSKIAERNEIAYGAFRNAIMKNRDWINERSMEIWKSKVTMAQRTMEQLAERGNFRALDFILRSNGIVPEERITTGEQEIHITLDDTKEN